MRDVTDFELANALLFCRSKDGTLCHLCAYSKFTGGICSKTLLSDASERITELVVENKQLKEKNNENR